MELLTEAEAQQKTEALLGEAIAKALDASPALYTDIVTLKYTADGSVAALSADTARLIQIRTGLVRTILNALSDKNRMVTSIPVSSLLGINLLSDSPAITVTLSLTRAINAYFLSEFSESGINQTIHRILFCVELDVYALIPGRALTVSVVREFTFAETVIVGKVPDAYTHIHRLTDDITETEIDDIYDFGAYRN